MKKKKIPASSKIFHRTKEGPVGELEENAFVATGRLEFARNMPTTPMTAGNPKSAV